MRFVLILLVALALTVTWQTTVLAGIAADHADMFSEKPAQGADTTGTTGDDEPECE